MLHFVFILLFVVPCSCLNIVRQFRCMSPNTEQEINDTHTCLIFFKHVKIWVLNIHIGENIHNKKSGRSFFQKQGCRVQGTNSSVELERSALDFLHVVLIMRINGALIVWLKYHISTSECILWLGHFYLQPLCTLEWSEVVLWIFFCLAKHK